MVGKNKSRQFKAGGVQIFQRERFPLSNALRQLVSLQIGRQSVGYDLPERLTRRVHHLADELFRLRIDFEGWVPLIFVCLTDEFRFNLR